MGSPGGGVDSGSGPGGGGGPGGGDGPGRGSDEDSRASNRPDSPGQRGMTGSERTQEQAFDDAMDRERANQPGGPEGGDTTPGYSGPNPDPRGPALSDGPDDRQDEDQKPAGTGPGGLPASDTTPNYSGPSPDPRGPALGGDEDDDKPALALAGTVALGFAAADGPISPIGDVIGIAAGLGILGYAGYQAMMAPPASPPMLSEKPEDAPENIGDQPARPADKPGKIAAETGLTEKEVKDRIHDAKRNLPRGGNVRNPDVAVDLDTGEIHPKNKDGTYGDSIGNIFDN